MQCAPTTKLMELQNIMSKMSFEVCCMLVLPEFGVRWRDLSRAVRNSRLPMTPSSIARVICKGVAKNLPAEEVDEIISRLRLKLVATENRVWHVIKLLEPLTKEPVETAELPERMLQVLRNTHMCKNRTAEVQIAELDYLVFASVQLTSETKSSPPLYLATAPGVPVALTSTVRAGALLKACVLGLGYKSYEDACLHGHDIPSLLRIHAGATENVDHLTEIPEYAPVPVVTDTGIDYTNRVYDEQYVDNILGPSPPLLTDLNVKSSKMFFDPQRLNKVMNISLELKSENVAETLKSWVVKGVLAPTSDLFQIFHNIKSNSITYTAED